MKPKGTLVLKLSLWGEEPRMSVKRCEAAEKFFPVNGHKFVAKVKEIISCHLNQWPDRLLMSLYSVQPVETSYGASENRYDLLDTRHKHIKKYKTSIWDWTLALFSTILFQFSWI